MNKYALALLLCVVMPSNMLSKVQWTPQNKTYVYLKQWMKLSFKLGRVDFALDCLNNNDCNVLRFGETQDPLATAALQWYIKYRKDFVKYVNGVTLSALGLVVGGVGVMAFSGLARKALDNKAIGKMGRGVGGVMVFLGCMTILGEVLGLSLKTLLRVEKQQYAVIKTIIRHPSVDITLPNKDGKTILDVLYAISDEEGLFELGALAELELIIKEKLYSKPGEIKADKPHPTSLTIPLVTY